MGSNSFGQSIKNCMWHLHFHKHHSKHNFRKSASCENIYMRTYFMKKKRYCSKIDLTPLLIVLWITIYAYWVFLVCIRCTKEDPIRNKSANQFPIFFLYIYTYWIDIVHNYRKVASSNASRFVTHLVYNHTQNDNFLNRSSSRL